MNFRKVFRNKNPKCRLVAELEVCFFLWLCNDYSSHQDNDNDDIDYNNDNNGHNDDNNDNDDDNNDNDDDNDEDDDDDGGGNEDDNEDKCDINDRNDDYGCDYDDDSFIRLFICLFIQADSQHHHKMRFS